MQGFLDIFDIYLLEAVVNGILLGGVLALLALGLNLIFGVIDVTWICYAELVMIGWWRRWGRRCITSSSRRYSPRRRSTSC
jgi:branched-chain amino acid transport system permease protein